MATVSKSAQRSRRHFRLRKKISGTPVRPRLVVTRSARHLFVQVVDDTKGVTVASASTMEAEFRGSKDDKTAKAYATDPNSPYRFYYRNLYYKLRKGKRDAVFTQNGQTPENPVPLEEILDQLVIAGSVNDDGASGIGAAAMPERAVEQHHAAGRS